MEYRNEIYAIYQKKNYVMRTKDDSYVSLLKITSDKKEIAEIKETGFNNRHFDFYGEVFYDDVYTYLVKKTEIEAAFQVDTHTIFKGEEWQVFEEKDGRVLISGGSYALAREYKQDYYNGFRIWVKKNELTEIWEDLKPVSGYPFPKDYPIKIILHEIIQTY
jgi:hypothetical protein